MYPQLKLACREIARARKEGVKDRDGCWLTIVADAFFIHRFLHVTPLRQPAQATHVQCLACGLWIYVVVAV